MYTGPLRGAGCVWLAAVKKSSRWSVSPVVEQVCRHRVMAWGRLCVGCCSREEQ